MKMAGLRSPEDGSRKGGPDTGRGWAERLRSSDDPEMQHSSIMGGATCPPAYSRRTNTNFPFFHWPSRFCLSPSPVASNVNVPPGTFTPFS